MKKSLLFCLLLISAFSFSQITFEKSYFIDNNDQKIDCFIKNLDWKFNPKSFIYKISEDSEEITATIKKVKEFEIYNQSHYVRANVKIDSSSEELTQLSAVEKPEFVDEELFLKQLTNGDAQLYRYSNGKYTRFFYQMENSGIQQLIYKMYFLEGNSDSANRTTFAYNESYKNQLRDALKCSALTAGDLKNLSYLQGELTKLFNKYNACADPSFVQTSQIKKTQQLHLNIRPRINFNSLSLTDIITSKYYDTEDKTTFGVGLELEYILPLNKGKWSIIFEPTYQYYKTQTATDLPFFREDIITTVDYKSIELPLGIRYYLFLNENSKFFINAQFAVNVNFSSSLEVDNQAYGISRSYEVKSAPSVAFGVGYKFKDKYAAEFRYFTDKNITAGRKDINTNYKSLSFILSYTLF